MASAVKYLKRSINSTKAFHNYMFSQAKEYRSNVFIKILGFPVRFIIIFSLWSAVLANSGDNLSYYIWYYAGVFLTILMYPYVRMATGTVGQQIFTGEINKYLIKGIPYWTVRLADWLVVARWYIPIIMGSYVTLYCLFNKEFNLLAILQFFFLFIIGSLMMLVLWTLVGLSAFWFEQTVGIARLFSFIQEALTGALIPISLFPQIIQTISSFLPFQYFVYIPLEVLTQRIQGTDSWLHCLYSVSWIGIMLICAKWLWQKGLKIYSAPM